MGKVVVEMKNISKRFPGILANDNISLQLKEGEIHALLGENGAGKSTLMSILFGFYTASSGKIYIKGEEVDIKNPNIAFEYGIGMVHQHFQLIDSFTVTENIILGSEPGGVIVDYEEARNRVKELSEKYNLQVDPDAKIEDISVGMQQRVEILKVLYRNADIIILDEPTAVLTPHEIDELIDIMKDFALKGKSILLITHKLKEIMTVADRVSVLRRGKYMGTVDVDKTNEMDLAERMVGRSVTFKVEKTKAKPGEKILEVKDLVVKNERGIKSVNNLSLDVYSGEILGIAGIDGNGQREFIEAISGLTDIESGSILYSGKNIENKSVKERIEMGIAHIPEDRQKRGLVMDFNLSENIILKKYDKNPYSINGLISKIDVRNKAEEIIDTFDVRSGRGADSIVRGMSGGNQQKAIIGREIDTNPSLILASQPTRGLDVGAIEYIHKRLVDIRDDGRAVLLVSFELDEIMALSDRVAVFYKGKLAGIVDPLKSDEREIGLMMSGSKGIYNE